ncbi:MAG TPA: transporter [Candidatus Polarisedimenticolia bacterium]|nr:transporter [Candidatus Polarisedimenticolia bacterium]
MPAFPVARVVVIAAAGLFAAAAPVRGQSIEPRLFSNVPIGMNFVIGGYTHASGGVLLDPSVPLEDASVGVHSAFAGYSRSIAVAGRSAQIQGVFLYAWLSGEALFTPTGEVRARDVNGLGDPAVRFMVNLHGAPALSAPQFRGYRQDLVVGASLQITAPLGQYDPDRLVNLGTNRWTFKPEFGLSQALGHWILEATGAVSLYTDNDDFLGGQHRSQDPIYSAQGHGIYIFRPGLWTALDVTWYTGGRTAIDGVPGDDLQRNWRAGLTLAVPMSASNSLKLYVSKGVSTRAGGDFTLAGVGWQHHWGGAAAAPPPVAAPPPPPGASADQED